MQPTCGGQLCFANQLEAELIRAEERLAALKRIRDLLDKCPDLAEFIEASRRAGM